MMWKRIRQILLLLFTALSVTAAEGINFLERPLSAGKALLESPGFSVSKVLGIGNFSPELRLPIQLFYDSTAEFDGAMGFGWNISQLTSRAIPEADGMTWTSPWGEKVRFFREEGKMTLYAPYSDWSAQGKDGNWTISGKNGKAGWNLIYRDSFVARLNTPSGRTLEFSYRDGRLAALLENDVKLITIAYNADGLVESVTVNGVATKFAYRSAQITRPATNPNQTDEAFSTQLLSSIQTGDLAAVEFSYDAQGYLTGQTMADWSESYTLQQETPQDRSALLAEAAAAKAKGQPYDASGRAAVAGRLTSDGTYTYEYPAAGTVKLTDKAGNTAEYSFDAQRGTMRIADFSGQVSNIYYYRRYDVAYNGKVRQITDGANRIVTDFRYDDKTGQMLSSRDLFGNETLFTYNDRGDQTLIQKRAADSAEILPVASLAYNFRHAPTTISRLDEKGRPYNGVQLTYDTNNQPLTIDDGSGVTHLEYNKFGQVTAQSDRFGLVTKMAYDSFNRLIGAIDPSGAYTQLTYNGNGQVEKVERFDRYGEGAALLNSLAVSYDKMGRPVAYTDQAGNTKKLELDSFGRTVKELFPDNTAVEYRYDEMGRLATVVDQNSHEINFAWNRYGLDAKTTAMNQLTDYRYNDDGKVAEVISKFADQESSDRAIAYEYDKFNRVIKATFDAKRSQEFTYDVWGRIASVTATDGDEVRKAEMNYDYFSRLTERTETLNGEAFKSERFAYDNQNRRTLRETTVGGSKLAETRQYDALGRLSKIVAGTDEILYEYNAKNQLTKRTSNNLPVYYTYTSQGQLATKSLGGEMGKDAIATLEYFYTPAGQISGRSVNGAKATYQYDVKGQLLAVLSGDDSELERYEYDAAGNILSKTLAGVKTTFSYDASNQLQKSESEGIVKNYAYDAAGRLVKAAETVYSYGWLDKVLEVRNGDTLTKQMSYGLDGQIANVKNLVEGVDESFVWDGLALIQRNSTSFVNEPAVTGGNPIVAGGKALFDDMLGSSMGVMEGNNFTAIDRTAFGETTSASEFNFFTGKPEIEDLGYTFLLRNYQANTGKWQTSDPLGYPDGWNNLAYVNNSVTMAIDWLGGKELFTQSATMTVSPYEVLDIELSAIITNTLIGLDILKDLSYRVTLNAYGNDSGSTPTISGEHFQLTGGPHTSGGGFEISGIGYLFTYTVRIGYAGLVSSNLTTNNDGSQTLTNRYKVTMVVDWDYVCFGTYKGTATVENFYLTLSHTRPE